MDVRLQERLIMAVETIANSIVNIESDVMDIQREIQNTMNNMSLNLCDIRNALGYAYDSGNINISLSNLSNSIMTINGDIYSMATQLQVNNEVIVDLIKTIKKKGLWL